MKAFLAKAVVATGLVSCSPLISHAQTLGASFGVQVLLDTGRVLQNSQIYTRQRGIGATNLDTILTVPAPAIPLPSSIAETPLPIIQADIPSDFRLSITNTDQIENTQKILKSSNASITITSSPTTIQLR
ncbi:hypothetical protein KBZ14_09140 [Synechococcus sp. HJ21-Hayes]|uniref:hypothetical protein n=1 Tax=unclassified Synechococcus TaxID=2626047 RepID=UPI0020CCF1C8|nr:MULTISPECIES: hypothetical protein [unclassified Synechococcus]MCP9832224.1 hypothetical protein [Synechococcus sp. JJ3a-Johnson]MCP9853031.1 hypothetical protein [Synechococcus sp. HJ21-Hayes]